LVLHPSHVTIIVLILRMNSPAGPHL